MELWYALHVRSNDEGRVSARLAARNLEAFYPHYLEKSQDRRRDIERKFFPGYVFTRVDLGRTNPAAGIPQVVRILGAGDNHPIAIPASEIESVRILTASPLASVSAPCPFLHRGDLVTVKWGPLAGATGYVMRHAGKMYLVITVETLGQSRRVQIERAAVGLLRAA